MPKKTQNSSGLVYSTDPDFKLTGENIDTVPTLLPAQQDLQIKSDGKGRAGKVVTLVQGFQGKEIHLEDLGKKLKSYCGTGGSVKGNEIIIQGDHRDKVLSWLQKQGYKRSKKV